MPQENKTAPQAMDDPTEAQQHDVLEPTDDESWLLALEVVRDYRGDVTIHLRDGSELSGFVFDIRLNNERGSVIRMDLPGTGTRKEVAVESVAKITLSGRNTAAGKSWENWLRRYAEKRLAGEKASIECEPLNEPPTTSS